MFRKITAITYTSITNKIKTFKNFGITIEAMKTLSKDLFLLSELNQDPLENFFGAIRQQGGNCREPTLFNL